MDIQPKPEIEDIQPFYRFEAMAIANDADCESAAMVLKELKTRLDQAEKWRKEVTGPIKAGVKKFEDRVRQVTGPLQRIEATVKQKLAAYWDSQRAVKEAEAQKQRDAEIEAAKQLAQENLDTAVATGSETAQEAAVRFERHAERLVEKSLDVSQTVRTSGATVAQATYFDWHVTDPTAIPREYFILDEKRLDEIARGYRKEPVEIPGIAFTVKSRVITR